MIQVSEKSQNLLKEITVQLKEIDEAYLVAEHLQKKSIQKKNEPLQEMSHNIMHILAAAEQTLDIFKTTAEMLLGKSQRSNITMNHYQSLQKKEMIRSLEALEQKSATLKDSVFSEIYDEFSKYLGENRACQLMPSYCKISKNIIDDSFENSYQTKNHLRKNDIDHNLNDNQSELEKKLFLPYKNKYSQTIQNNEVSGNNTPKKPIKNKK